MACYGARRVPQPTVEALDTTVLRSKLQLLRPIPNFLHQRSTHYATLFYVPYLNFHVVLSRPILRLLSPVSSTELESFTSIPFYPTALCSMPNAWHTTSTCRYSRITRRQIFLSQCCTPIVLRPSVHTCCFMPIASFSKVHTKHPFPKLRTQHSNPVIASPTLQSGANDSDTW